jgi:predicted PurR-regulated permease PerM
VSTRWQRSSPSGVRRDAQPPSDESRAPDGRSPDDQPGPPASSVPPTLVTAAAWLWRLLLAAASLWLVAAAARRLMLLLVPVAVAVVLTALLKPPVDRLHRHGWPRLAATWAVLLGALVLAGALVGVLTPRFLEEFDRVGPAAEDALASVEEWLVEAPLGLDRSEVRDLRRRAAALLSPGSGDGSRALTGAVLALEVLAGVVLSLVLAFFFVKDADAMVAWSLDQLNARAREPARRMGAAAWAALSGYLRGVTLLAAFTAAATAVGLALIGVPLVLPLAVVEFFFSFVPIVGAVAAGALAALVALSSGGLTDALLVVVLAVAIDQVEGNFFQPVVIGRSVKLHPVVVLVVLTAGAILFGVVGALVAVPLTAATAAAVGQLRAWREARGE